MMLLQAGQLGLYRRDSFWTSEIPPEMVAGATVWLDFTDTATLYAGDHLDGGNVTTSGDSVLSVNSKVSPGFGVVSVGGAPAEFRTSATPSGRGATVFNNSLAKYMYYDMRAPATTTVPMSTIVTTTTKLVIAAVKVAGSSPFNGYDSSNGDIILGDGGFFGLFVTEDSGVISARASNIPASQNHRIDLPIGRDTWVVLTASHQSGSLRLRVNGGAWATVSSGSTETLSQSPYVMSNSNATPSSEITIAHIFSANTAQTDAAISAVEHWVANDVGITPWW